MAAFTPKDWEDAPSTATPITAAELERIETAVAKAFGQVWNSDTGQYEQGRVYAGPADPSTSGESDHHLWIDTTGGGGDGYTDEMAVSAVGGKLWFGTQVSYDAITAKDPNTLYVVL